MRGIKRLSKNSNIYEYNGKYAWLTEYEAKYNVVWYYFWQMAPFVQYNIIYYNNTKLGKLLEQADFREE